MVSKMQSNMKYILVTGGVISGIGKGVVASSFGTILKCCGLNVTSIKVDPYINIDAGTFSPYEHGEVYVLDDGGEVDLDLGNYERFLDITLHSDNNITTGKIYQHVINKERRGDYLGKTVQVVPHITDAVQEWVEKVAQQSVSKDGKKPQICIIELGGTVGDIESMSFIEAFRQFQFRVKRENFCCAHISLVPQPKATGESKTKPTQSSVRELRGLGLSPDLIICRSDNPIDQSAKEKISSFCHVTPEQVIDIPDLETTYRVPIILEQQNIIEYLNERLQLNLKLPAPRRLLQKWKDLADRSESNRRQVSIALVGKYTKMEDAYASVMEALKHAVIACGYTLRLNYVDASNLEEATKIEEPVLYHQAWEKLCKCQGVIVPGGFGKRGIEGKILACHWARLNSKPFLGICMGFQCAVIEYARNILKLDAANSKEIDPETKHPVIVDMPEHNTGQMGGTMRLGKRKTFFVNESSILKKLYQNVETIEERHRHRYEVNTDYIEQLENHGMKFVGKDSENVRMEILELNNHPYYVGTQFHPEYLSRPLKPSPPFLGFILASIGRLPQYFSKMATINSKKGNQVNKITSTVLDSSDSDTDEEILEPLNQLGLNSESSSAFSSGESNCGETTWPNKNEAKVKE